jgi:Tol biopolymer transport system component
MVSIVRGAGMVLIALTALSTAAVAQVMERVSLSSSGADENGNSEISCRAASMSSDGRYVVFQSDASNLVDDDGNGMTDVFLRDRVLATTTRVSVDVDGNDGDGASLRPCITPDGRYVVFQSDATDLVAGDINGAADVFIRDLSLQTTARVSLDHTGLDGDGASRVPSISADGRYVAFISNATDLVIGDGNGVADIFVRDLQTGTNERVSVNSLGGDPDLNSWTPDISADGRYVAFHSAASNLVPGDGGMADIFVRDRQLGQTVRVTGDHLGGDPDGNSYGANISADGRHVAFWSRATDLVSDDTNGLEDVYVHDLDSSTTSRVSLRSDGSQITDLPSWSSSLSQHGRFVVYFADSDQLLDEDANGFADIFAFDRATGGLFLLNRSASGDQGNNWSSDPKVTPDGQYVLFQSFASNLVDDDTNGMGDVFLCRGPAFVFEDGFESGETTAWSQELP